MIKIRSATLHLNNKYLNERTSPEREVLNSSQVTVTRFLDNTKFNFAMEISVCLKV